jgi:hypothetical protein
MKSLFMLILLMAILFSCGEKKYNATIIETAVEEIKKAETDFSNLSAKEGMRKAFLQYIDSSGVLLRPGHNPIVGKAARDFLDPINDSAFTLTWIPSAVFASMLGDMGYTYGIYTYKDKDTTSYGTYVSIWKRQNDGSWKYVLDTGNPGIEKNP